MCAAGGGARRSYITPGSRCVLSGCCASIRLTEETVQVTVANAIGAATAERSSAGRNVATLERVKAILGEAGETRALEGLGK